MANTLTKKELSDQLQAEVDASFLYKKLSENTDDASLADIYRQMSEIERIHIGRVLEMLKEYESHAKLPSPSFQTRLQVRVGKIIGFDFILNNLIKMEETMGNNSLQMKREAGEELSGNEMNHATILNNIYSSSKGVAGGTLAKLEGRHKSVGGNALRAAVLGANDGLVSNLSLIMGVAGATSGRKEVIIAGFAGMLAGSISMALGEWLSVQSSRELYMRQIQMEQTELETSPQEEMMELSLIYQSKGIAKEAAEEMAKKVLENKDTAVDTLVREELGIDKDELGGSAWEAAFTSFFLFTIGAIIPLAPFLFLTGYTATFTSLGFSVVGLFILGAAITLFTGKKIMHSGFRQILFGLAAAIITFGIGKLIGVAVIG